MSKTVLEAQALEKSVTTTQGNLSILHHIDLKVTKGESIAITGASGSGKTTLLGLLAGLDTSTAGKIQLLEQDLTQLDEDQRARLRKGKVGFVFQSFHLQDNLTALENVMLPLELLPSTTGITDKAKQALAQVGLADRLHHMATQLSGGEQQRVAIARAFVTQPELLFADEPTGNLDHATGKEIIELLFGLQQDIGTTLVLVTHDIKLAQQCQKHYSLQDGKLTLVAGEMQ